MTTTCSTYYNHHGQPDKIYNEEGYIALHGDSVSYHFFERDYLGSVRAVFDLYGNLEQTNDYNVTGIPSSRHLGNADVHKHTGKEFQGFNGLAWYDNNARYYDPILARFTTQDPLAEKYPWLSPYCHCANNPLKFVDRDGLRPTEKEAARMADYVYGNGNVSLIGDWIKSENNFGISINHNDSGFKSMLFERTVDGVTEYAYAFAGTDLTSIKDWGNNIVQLIGMSKQYSIAMNNAQILTDELDSQELTFVGHSLGGGLAAASAYATNGTAMTFNAAGVSPFTVEKSSNAKIDAYITIRDELNLFQRRMGLPTADGKKHWRSGLTKILGHDIENFYKPNLFKQVKNWLFEKF